MSVALAALLLAGCSGGNNTSAGESTPSTTTTTPSQAATTPSGTPTVSAAKWLAGVNALGEKMNAAIPDNVVITAKELRAEAKALGRCDAELLGLGPHPGAMEPVFVLAKQGCAKYVEASKCFVAAAGTDINKADKCLDAVNRASDLFSTAQVTGDGILDSTN